MNKITIQSLNDYLEDRNDINLKLFIHSINPLADYKKNEIIALIDKYSKDKNNLRLKAIEQYLGKQKNKKIKSIKYLPEKVELNPEKLDILNKLKIQYKNNMGRMGNKLAESENTQIRQKIDEIESELGLKYEYDKIPESSKYESELNILKGVLGDWEVEGSISWELLNGNKTYFEVNDSGKTNTSGLGMTGLIKYLEKYSGRKIRPFNYQFTFPHGSTGKARWVFSLTPIMESTQMMTQKLQGYNELEKLQ